MDQTDDPDDWLDSDEPMTDEQATYLRTVCEDANVPFDPDLTKGDASRRIAELQRKVRKIP